MYSKSKAQRGFTMIEIMLSITVLSILLAVAVPSFLDTVRNNRLITQNNEFVGALNLARNEAWKRGNSVSMCASADQATCSGATDWTTGWIVFNDVNGNGSLDAGDGLNPLLQAWAAAPPEYTLTSTNRSFVRYNPTGTSAAGAEIFDLVRTGCTGLHARRININMVGRIATTTVACP
jgi:type IV fimbrial biogenesis protein FimT